MPKLKNIIIFIVIATGIFAGYFFFLKSEPEETNLLSSPAESLLKTNNPEGLGAPEGKPAVAENFLSLFLSVKNIKLEGAVFADSAFKSLRDSSIELVPDSTEGRPNPFAKLGSDVPPPPIAPPKEESLPKSAPDDNLKTMPIE